MLCYGLSFSYNSKITKLFLEPNGANDFAPTVLELQRIYLQAHQRKDRNCCERKMLTLICIVLQNVKNQITSNYSASLRF